MPQLFFLSPSSRVLQTQNYALFNSEYVTNHQHCHYHRQFTIIIVTTTVYSSPFMLPPPVAIIVSSSSSLSPSSTVSDFRLPEQYLHHHPPPSDYLSMGTWGYFWLAVAPRVRLKYEWGKMKDEVSEYFSQQIEGQNTSKASAVESTNARYWRHLFQVKGLFLRQIVL